LFPVDIDDGEAPNGRWAALRRVRTSTRQDPAMIKYSLYALAPLAALISTSAASAQNYAGFCSQCQTQQCQSCKSNCQSQCFSPCAINQTKYEDSFYMNQIWPRQYMAPARRGICQTFALMTTNGWQRNNLLGKYDFDPKGEGLSEAGRLHVEWILTQAPPNRRTIFVQRGVNAEDTARRVDAVQTLASNMYPSAGPADVQETIMQEYGRPAAMVDAVFTGFSANQPPPILPASGASSSGDGS